MKAEHEEYWGENEVVKTLNLGHESKDQKQSGIHNAENDSKVVAKPSGTSLKESCSALFEADAETADDLTSNKEGCDVVVEAVVRRPFTPLERLIRNEERIRGDRKRRVLCRSTKHGNTRAVHLGESEARGLAERPEKPREQEEQVRNERTNPAKHMKASVAEVQACKTANLRNR